MGKNKCSSARSEIQKLIGYTFKNPDLLDEARTHGSSNRSLNYHRLEFLGDAVISCLIATVLVESDGGRELNQGQLTLLRKDIVDNEKLACVCIFHDLNKYLIHNEKKFHSRFKEFKRELRDNPERDQWRGLVSELKVLADLVESLIGAVFLDSDYSLEKAWKVFVKLLKPLINPDKVRRDPKTMLKELCERMGWKEPYYDYSVWEKRGIVRVRVNGFPPFESGKRCSNKDVAIARAAKAALESNSLKEYSTSIFLQESETIRIVLKALKEKDTFYSSKTS
ncbi:PREDICTED: ribonuclease 3-like protein 3 [Nelumbo nucifera]|uniref:Ribonuclease 3-like protein 3 n=2 Tax=Nelumbo nucifera TaxID=4432 RepID=A0A1U7YU22_NELNU|nr:PREDICTED: ribonuclease 3-like protein 3 [Nelumbo nucifera]DAD39079.1 TPA_asm: hypothetical protein HUJ06_013402 [Nelumbo nucifera]